MDRSSSNVTRHGTKFPSSMRILEARMEAMYSHLPGGKIIYLRWFLWSLLVGMMDDEIPKIWKNKKCSKPPTSYEHFSRKYKRLLEAVTWNDTTTLLKCYITNFPCKQGTHPPVYSNTVIECNWPIRWDVLHLQVMREMCPLYPFVSFLQVRVSDPTSISRKYCEFVQNSWYTPQSFCIPVKIIKICNSMVNCW